MCHKEFTGRGSDDDARGMLEMKEAGAYNFNQDEATCIVYGMPQEAVQRGAVDKVVPFKDIADTLLLKCKG
jgi:two-component system chemotaxis response regulator CheB